MRSHTRLLVSQSDRQVIRSNRLAVAASTDEQDSISPIQLSFTFVFVCFFPPLHLNPLPPMNFLLFSSPLIRQAYRSYGRLTFIFKKRDFKQAAFWIFNCLSSWSNCPPSRPANVIRQPLGDFSQSGIYNISTNQWGSMHSLLLLHPSVWLPICIRLFQSTL